MWGVGENKVIQQTNFKMAVWVHINKIQNRKKSENKTTGSTPFGVKSVLEGVEKERAGNQASETHT